MKKQLGIWISVAVLVSSVMLSPKAFAEKGGSTGFGVYGGYQVVHLADSDIHDRGWAAGGRFQYGVSKNIGIGLDGAYGKETGVTIMRGIGYVGFFGAGRVAPYVTVGGAFLRASAGGVSDNGFGIAARVGVDIGISGRVGFIIEAQYEKYFKDGFASPITANGGLMFHF